MESIRYENYHENKAHTTPDFPYNTYLCSIPLDFTEVASHWHNEAELIVIKKGRGIVEVDLETYEAKEGCMVFILPGQLHSIRQDGDYSMEYENILFDPSFIGAEAGDLCGGLLLPLFEGKLSHSTVISSAMPYHREALNCIDRIDFLCSEKPYGYQLGVKGNLFSFFFCIVNNHTEAAQHTARGNSIEKIKLILSFISENYSRKITTNEAAAVCYYSNSHFMRFFKDTMGMGFIQYLNNYRLRIAAQLLLSSEDSIIDIAADAGFDNLSYFNRCFKKKYGITPGQYRQGVN